MRHAAIGVVALTILLPASLTQAQGGAMSVQVKQGAVRATPSFMGQVVANLNYGDRVQITDKKPGWFMVAAGSVSGWMHVSSLTEKKIVFKAGDGEVQTGATSTELALAGKGFNAGAEAQFRTQNRGADFAAVNHMEQRQVTQQEMMQFLRAGGIRPTEGGAR